MKPLLNKVIISGGGTGGHIFPALAIANALKAQNPQIEILFVGALGKMEMEKIPQAGYEIVGLQMSGLKRKLSLSNLWVPMKLLMGIWKAKGIIKKFKPDAVVGVGGYASSALVYAAASLKVPILIQEQNSYAGLTNKWLANKASKICVAYENMERFFPKEKIQITGNPVRSDLFLALSDNQEQAKIKLGFEANLPLVLVLGGSLGARTINQSIQHAIRVLHAKNIQVYWQTGKFFEAESYGLRGVKIEPFVNDMRTAYAAADIVVSRAGALSVSELCLLGKACILIPSPNVAEDHQTKNAEALVQESAAVLVKDQDAEEKLLPAVLHLIENPEEQELLKKRILTFAKPKALEEIVHALNEIV